MNVRIKWFTLTSLTSLWIVIRKRCTFKLLILELSKYQTDKLQFPAFCNCQGCVGIFHNIKIKTFIEVEI